MSEGVGPGSGSSDRLAELRTSARGWQGVQLAVLGFIGLCGVLQRGDASDPTWLQILAGLLVLLSLALACLATYLVGRAAWPLYGRGGARADDERELDVASRQLVTGLKLTFVAVAVLALAGTSSWWPQDEAGGGGLVEVQGAGGETFCGRLADAEAGTLRLETDGEPVVVRIDALAAVRAVDSCG